MEIPGGVSAVAILIRRGINYQILWRDELCIIAEIKLGSVKIIVMNSYIKPKDAKGNRTNKVATVKKHWKKVKDLMKKREVLEFMWSGDFNLQR